MRICPSFDPRVASPRPPIAPAAKSFAQHVRPAAAAPPPAASDAFQSSLVSVAQRLGMRPSHLYAVMWFESHLAPRARNASSGAVGLIQFTPHTASKLLGVPPQEAAAAIARMSPEDQLVLVERYMHLALAGRRVDSLRDAYMAVFFPQAVGKGPDFVIARADDESAFGRAVYAQNAALDRDGDGVITAAEAAAAVEAASSAPRMREWMARLDAQVPPLDRA